LISNPTHNKLEDSKNINLGSTLCVTCGNERCLINKSLESSAVMTFTKVRKEIRCKKGQQFIMEGAPVSGLFFILSGKVKVLRTGINGREQIVRFAKPGEIIGHRGYGTEEYYPIGAVALEDTVLCYFSKESLQEVLRKDASLTYNMMLFYANELNKSEAKVKSLSQMTVREKVIDTLLYISRKFGFKNGFIDLPLSRKEYADCAGTTEEQVIRVFSALKKEGLIIAKGKKIGIPKVHLLKEEISEHNFFLNS